VEGHENIGMTSFHDDDVVKPFTPLPDNRIRVVDFLTYVANHQNEMVKYKNEYQVNV